MLRNMETFHMPIQTGHLRLGPECCQAMGDTSAPHQFRSPTDLTSLAGIRLPHPLRNVCHFPVDSCSRATPTETKIESCLSSRSRVKSFGSRWRANPATKPQIFPCKLEDCLQARMQFNIIPCSFNFMLLVKKLESLNEYKGKFGMGMHTPDWGGIRNPGGREH